MTKDEINHTIERGEKYPYDTETKNKDWATKASRTILADLQDRRGIKNVFYDIDEDIRNEIVESMSAYITECHNRYSGEDN